MTRFLTKALPNGRVHQFDHQTGMTTVYRVTAKFTDGRIAIAVDSGPQPADKEPWELAHAVALAAQN